MIKSRKGNTIIDILVAVLFVSTILFFCYYLASSSINKRQQVILESQAMLIAENIMGRTISKGAYTIEDEPYITDSIKNEINQITNDDTKSLAEKNKLIVELGGRLPVNVELDAQFLPQDDVYRNKFSYQVIVDDYIATTGVDSSGSNTYSRFPSLKRITVNVYYPAKVSKHLNSRVDAEKIDKLSLEEEYRVVSISTYKSAREYTTE